MAVILCIAQIYNPLEVQGQTVATSYKVNLVWDVHPDPTINGYRVYYGTVPGVYTTQISVGNVTQATVSGLASGITYYFAITALNTSGLQSAYSSVVTFKPGTHTASIRRTATGQTVLKVKGLIGQRYNLEATQDMKSWVVISSVVMPDGGSVDLLDLDASRFSKRFYRTRKAP